MALHLTIEWRPVTKSTTLPNLESNVLKQEQLEPPVAQNLSEN
jgi:hypothetical protein